MARVRDIRPLRKFAAVYVSVHSHFNRDRHRNRRIFFEQDRLAAVAEWH